MTPAAVANIRPDALRNNLEMVRRLAPGCRVLAVVKANAYGHGLVTVARAIPDADGFAVARLEEAIQLRDAGIPGKIVVLGGVTTAGELAAARHAGLDLVVHCMEQVDLLDRGDGSPPLQVWIKVDSGMGRLGLAPASFAQAARRLAALPGVTRPVRAMTHLASADETGSPATREQLQTFGETIGDWPGDVSIANSAAIIGWSEARGEPSGLLRYRGENWVRPGLLLYGVSPLGDGRGRELGLEPAMSFETRIIAVNRIARGRRVGYAGDWQAPRDSLIAVAAAGYGDGYPWHVATRTPVVVNGQRAPVVGRVSMDLITIDVTGLPDCRVGDRIVLWGDDPGVTEVARCAGRISYDLLTGVSPRVIRIAGQNGTAAASD